MVIQLSIEQTEPLTGSAVDERGAPVHFVGWMAMLRAISDLVDSRADQPERSSQPSRAGQTERGVADRSTADRGETDSDTTNRDEPGRGIHTDVTTYLTLVQPTDELREQA